MPTTFSLDRYQFMIDEEGLSLIQLAYCILEDFELELPDPDTQINNLPLGHLGCTRKHSKQGRDFPSPHSFSNFSDPMELPCMF